MAEEDEEEDALGPLLSEEEVRGPGEEVQLLQKVPSERTEQDVLRIARTVGGVSFFSNLAPTVRYKCFQKLRHEYVPAGRILFEIGDEPRLFYIVLSGMVGVYVKEKKEEEKDGKTGPVAGRRNNQSSHQASGAHGAMRPTGSKEERGIDGRDRGGEEARKESRRTPSKDSDTVRSSEATKDPPSASERSSKGETIQLERSSKGSAGPSDAADEVPTTAAAESLAPAAASARSVPAPLTVDEKPPSPKKRLSKHRKRLASMFGFEETDAASGAAEAIMTRVGNRKLEQTASKEAAGLVELRAALRSASPRGGFASGRRARSPTSEASRPTTAMVLPPCERNLSDVAGFSRIDPSGAHLSPRGSMCQTPTAERVVVGNASMLEESWRSEAPGAMQPTCSEEGGSTCCDQIGELSAGPQTAASRILNAFSAGGATPSSRNPVRRSSRKGSLMANVVGIATSTRLGLLNRMKTQVQLQEKPIINRPDSQKLPMDMKQVAQFRRGQAFGEAAMLSDQGRLATCATLENSHFAVLERKDYLEILAGTAEQASREKEDFLKSIHPFGTMPEKKLAKIAAKLHLREMKKNDPVYQAGSDVIQIFFVRDGEFALRRNMGEPLASESQAARHGHHAGASADPATAAAGTDAGDAAGGAAGAGGGNSGADAGAHHGHHQMAVAATASAQARAAEVWCTVTLVTRPHVFGLAEYLRGAHTHNDTAVCQSAAGSIYMVPARELIPQLAPQVKARLEAGALAQEAFVQQRTLMMRRLAAPEVDGAAARSMTASGKERRSNSKPESRKSFQGQASRPSTSKAVYSPDTRLKAIRAAKKAHNSGKEAAPSEGTSHGKLQSLCVMDVPSFSGHGGLSIEVTDLSMMWPLDRCKIADDHSSAHPLRPPTSPQSARAGWSQAAGEKDLAGSLRSPRPQLQELQQEGALPAWFNLLHLDMKESPRRGGWRPPPHH